MQHLNIEDLARLVDEPPSAAEETHLARCPACSDELELLREQTAALAALPGLESPAAVWEGVRAQARAEGLVAPETRSVPGLRSVLIAASYIGILLIGAAGGFAFGPRGEGIGPAGSEAPPTLVAGSGSAAESAEHRLRAAEAEYTAALAHYAQITGASTGVDPVTRLAALDGIVLTTGAALETAPADPVLNGYFLTAVGQRDAILRQIAQTDQDGWF